MFLGVLSTFLYEYGKVIHRNKENAVTGFKMANHGILCVKSTTVL